MKDKVTYYADGSTTVCLLRKDGEVVARGISVCSAMDDWDRAEGRKNALNRAREAYGRKCDCAEIRLDVERRVPIKGIRLSLARDRFGDFRGYYKPVLTTTEEMLLDR